MNKEDDQAGNNAPLHRTDSSARNREALVGDDGFEAPKRPRAAAQIAAFEKARATRAAIMAKKFEKKPAHEPEPTPLPPAPEPVATPAPAPAGSLGVTRRRGGAALSATKRMLKMKANRRSARLLLLPIWLSSNANK